MSDIVRDALRSHFDAACAVTNVRASCRHRTNRRGKTLKSLRPSGEAPGRVDGLSHSELNVIGHSWNVERWIGSPQSLLRSAHLLESAVLTPRAVGVRRGCVPDDRAESLGLPSRARSEPCIRRTSNKRIDMGDGTRISSRERHRHQSAGIRRRKISSSGSLPAMSKKTKCSPSSSATVTWSKTCDSPKIPKAHSGSSARDAPSLARRPVRADPCRSPAGCRPTTRGRRRGRPLSRAPVVRSRRRGVCAGTHVRRAPHPAAR